MRRRRILLAITLLVTGLSQAFSANASTPFHVNESAFVHLPGSPELNDSNGWERTKTLRMIDDQEQALARRINNSIDMTRNQERARETLWMLRNQELQVYSDRLSIRGQEILEANPDLKSPASVVGVAAALWSGKSFVFSKSASHRLSSYLEVKSRHGSLWYGCNLINAQAEFEASKGFTFDVSRRFNEARLTTDLAYRFRERSVYAQVARELTEHLSLSIGSTQGGVMDQNAALTYNNRF